MASLVSGEASAHAHLHIDPTLEVPIKARCATCCPITSIMKKIFCCCSSECCNKTEIRQDRIVYCKSDGTCIPFDPSKSVNHAEDHKKTIDRVKTITSIEKAKRGSVISQETGVDLEAKYAKSEPLRLRELRRIQSIQ